MNYGKFFRLNQRTSKIDDGIAIYDYIDLPAYFEDSESNEMSPKYPISVTITENCVSFRVHYSAYKVKGEDSWNYLYNVKKAYNEDIHNDESDASKKDLKHMEEVILELPYESNNTEQLYNAIKDIYYSKYPYLKCSSSDARGSHDTGKTFVDKIEFYFYSKYPCWKCSSSATNDTHDIGKALIDKIKNIYYSKCPCLKCLLSGASESHDIGRTFIDELINKRYGKEEIHDVVEKVLYENIRKSQDGDLSYSTLWLMDIAVQNAEIGKNINLSEGDNDGNTVKFLRKLLLDFMFDLKHSDVFRTSKYYQSMYSGLMSNFYFSALLHKCEYYFYRGMIIDIVSKDLPTETKKKHISELYAQELIDAETLWIRDITNPLSEYYFEKQDYPEDREASGRPLLKIWYWIKVQYRTIQKEWKRFKFNVWPSWFAEPEEELRRVCFTMSEPNAKVGIKLWFKRCLTKEWICGRILSLFGIFDNPSRAHMCNGEIVNAYLGWEYNNDRCKKKVRENREIISRWFLKRFDFFDLYHLHLFNYANLLILLACIFFIIDLFTDYNFFDNNYMELLSPDLPNKLWHEISSVTIKWYYYLIFGIWIVWTGFRIKLSPRFLFERKRQVIVKMAIKLFMLALFIYTIAININNDGDFKIWNYLIIPILAVFALIKFVPNLHLVFPRLVASITAAWLTLSIGNELFGSFFDSIVSWSTVIWLSLIVLIFVIYEINHILPNETPINKLIRASEFLIISYLISFIIGLFIINFTGEKFLERSGVLNDFYKHYVYEPNPKQVGKQIYSFKASENHKQIEINEDTFDKLLLEELHNINITYDDSVMSPKNHSIVTTWNLPGDAIFFILRDFLIQFSFVAMFIGIFIQMLFEEKSVTEV